MKKTLIFAALMLGLTACQESLEEQAARQAKKFTEEKCPMQMEMQIMDSMVFDVPTRTLQKFYRLTGEADREDLEFDRLRQALIDELRNEPSYRVYRERGFNFEYVYRSEREPEKVLFQALLSKEDYK
ncbi:MAG: hypothetical protein IJV45_05275 [Prevotella sp.]|nr:hypothetical protein [Prevotella sp.]